MTDVAEILKVAAPYGGGVALAAISIAVGARVYITQIQTRLEAIKAAPEADRAKLVDHETASLGLTVEGLSPQQRFQLVQQVLSQRPEKVRLNFALVIIFMIVFFSLALVSLLWPNTPRTPNAPDAAMGPVVRHEPLPQPSVPVVSHSLVKIPASAIRVVKSTKTVVPSMYKPEYLFDGDEKTGWCVAESSDRVVEVSVEHPYQVTLVKIAGGWAYYSPLAQKYGGDNGDMWDHSLVVTKATVSWNFGEKNVSFNRKDDRGQVKSIEIPPNAGPIWVRMAELDGGTEKSGRFACWGEVELWGYELQ